MLRLIGNQFRKPTGLLGKIISKLMATGNSIAYNKIIPELEIQQNDSILEIGYGHGIGIHRIASGYDCVISGIDFSELMFKEATKRNRKHIDSKKVKLHCGDYLQSETTPNQFDKVFCINVIYFWNKLEEPFSKIKTELKDDGVFCIYMVHCDTLKKMKFTKDDIFTKYTIEQVLDVLSILGFGDISYKLDNGYIIKCKKQTVASIPHSSFS